MRGVVIILLLAWMIWSLHVRVSSLERFRQFQDGITEQQCDIFDSIRAEAGALDTRVTNLESLQHLPGIRNLPAEVQPYRRNEELVQEGRALKSIECLQYNKNHHQQCAKPKQGKAD